MISLEKPIEGIFIREQKNRFICEVMVEDEVIECYVPSSCHLDNFIDLHGKRVILLPTVAPSARTRYSLFAVPYKRNHILLNVGRVNSVIERDIKKDAFPHSASDQRYIENIRSAPIKAIYLSQIVALPWRQSQRAGTYLPADRS